MTGQPTPALLRRIADAAASTDRRRVGWAAKHPHAPLEVLYELIRRWEVSPDDGYTSRWTFEYGAGLAVANPVMPAEVAESHVLDPDSRLRAYALTHPHLSGDVLSESVQLDGAWPTMTARWPLSTTLAALRHPNMPVAELRDWATATNKHLLVAVTSNPSCPVDLLDRFASHRLTEVRKAVARNPSTPPAVLAEMREDRTAGVRTALLRRGIDDPEFLADSLTHTSPWVHSEVARRTQDPDALTALALSPSRAVRAAAVGNPACPEEGHVAAALLRS